MATWWEEPTHWKRPWCWERLSARGEGGDRRWDGWMASLTWCTGVWANSGRYWRTGKPWCAAVHGVANSRTWLSNWTTTAKAIILHTHKKRKRNLKCTVHSVKSYLISPANKKILLPNSRSLILAVNWCGHLYQLLMTAHIAIFTRSSLYLN